MVVILVHDVAHPLVQASNHTVLLLGLVLVLLVVAYQWVTTAAGAVSCRGRRQLLVESVGQLLLLLVKDSCRMLLLLLLLLAVGSCHDVHAKSEMMVSVSFVFRHA